MGVPLLFLIVSDYRERRVGVGWLLVFVGMQWGCAFWQAGVEVVMFRGCVNGGLLMGMGMCVAGYLSCRQRRWVNPLRGYVGAGDVLFLGGFVPVFSPREFVCFLTVSFAVSLGYWGVRQLRRGEKETVPLVSTVGGCYLLCLFYQVLPI